MWLHPRGSCDGIILIDKSEGVTSFNVVKALRKILGLTKVGHAGTLDPFASGLLIILLGQGTKLSPYLMAGERRYLASIRLGVETDTLDPTGHIVRRKPIPMLTSEEIEKSILKFVGKINQVPPAFSALSVKGKRAYKLARKGIKVQLPERVVKIHSLEIISIEMPVITIEVACSGGTYIRSLASDIGKRLSSVAHLSSLRRLSCGPFNVMDAIDFKEITLFETRLNLEDNIISLRDSLPDMKEFTVDKKMAEKIRNGYRLGWDEIGEGAVVSEIHENFIKIVNGKSLVAIMELGDVSYDDSNWFKNMRVFN
jgi:tRNA pseudouridine55 synthase